MAILDCHVHCRRYPEDFNVATIKRNLPTPMTDEELKKARAFSIEQLRDCMAAGSVDYALVLGLKSGGTLGGEIDNEWIANAVKPHRGKVWWGPAVVMTDSGAADEVEHCIRDLGAVAVGEIGPGYAHFSVDDPKCFPVYEVCRSYDVPILIHAGPVSPPNTRLKYGDVLALDEVCVNFPTLKVVVCHLGEPHYEETIHLMSKHANLYADVSVLPQVSGLIPRGAPPPVTFPYFHLDLPLLYYFAQAGRNKNKLLWATDIGVPNMTLMKDSIQGFRTVSQRLEKMGLPRIPEDYIERMFHENWKPVFTKIKV